MCSIRTVIKCLPDLNYSLTLSVQLLYTEFVEVSFEVVVIFSGKSWCKYWLSSSYNIPSLILWSQEYDSSKRDVLKGQVSVYGGGKFLNMLLDDLVKGRNWHWGLSSSRSIDETTPLLLDTVDLAMFEVKSCTTLLKEMKKLPIFIDTLLCQFQTYI